MCMHCPKNFFKKYFPCQFSFYMSYVPVVYPFPSPRESPGEYLDGAMVDTSVVDTS